MRAYVLTTGVLFLLLVIAHVWRVVEEGTHLLQNPLWIGITALAAALCLWAFRLWWSARHSA